MGREAHVQRSLLGHSLWVKESDTTEQLTLSLYFQIFFKGKGYSSSLKGLSSLRSSQKGSDSDRKNRFRKRKRLSYYFYNSL